MRSVISHDLATRVRALLERHSRSISSPRPLGPALGSGYSEGMNNSLKTVAVLATVILLNAASVHAQFVFGGAGRAASSGGASAAAWRAAMPALAGNLGIGGNANLLQMSAMSGLLAGTPLTPSALAALPAGAANAQVRDALALRAAPILIAGANAAAKDGASSKRFEKAFEDVLDLRLLAHLLPNEQFVLVQSEGAEIERLMMSRQEGAGKIAKKQARRMAEILNNMSRGPEVSPMVADEDGPSAAKRAFFKKHGLQPYVAAAPVYVPHVPDHRPLAEPGPWLNLMPVPFGAAPALMAAGALPPTIGPYLPPAGPPTRLDPYMLPAAAPATLMWPISARAQGGQPAGDAK